MCLFRRDGRGVMDNSSVHDALNPFADIAFAARGRVFVLRPGCHAGLSPGLGGVHAGLAPLLSEAQMQMREAPPKDVAGMVIGADPQIRRFGQ